MLQQQQAEEQHRARNNCKVLPRSVCDKCNSWRSRENERKKKEEKQRKTPRVASSFCTLATRRRINVHELKFVNLCVCECAGAQRGQHLHHLEAGLHPSGFCAMAISCYDCEMSSSWEELIKMLFIVVEKCHPNSSSPSSSLSAPLLLALLCFYEQLFWVCTTRALSECGVWFIFEYLLKFWFQFKLGDGGKGTRELAL